MIYVIVFAALIALRWAAGTDARKNATSYRILLVFLFFFCAFRFEVGLDWTGYYWNYRIQEWNSFMDAAEMRNPSFWILNEIVHQLNLPYPWVNVFVTIGFFAGFHCLAKRQNDPLGFLVLSFPVLIINMPMSALKQAVAVGFICIALTAYLDKKLTKFLFWSFAAASFHGSALIFLPLATLVKTDLTRRDLAFAGVLALPGVVALAYSSEAEVMQSRYIESSREATGAIFRLALLVATGLFFHFFLRHRWKYLFPSDYRLVGLGALMMIASSPAILASTIVGDRFGYYLIPIQLMIYNRFPLLFEGAPFQRFLSAAPYIGLFIFLVAWTSFSWHFQAGFLPYQTWLFGFPRSKYGFGY
ncbi:EpsG family protein [Neorhodopirellula lusitana]|uniref:EpsG family protein n=1 Tax=Neorhodopirellula lusitana TaxID=445327 RepID=UPI00384FA932